MPLVYTLVVPKQHVQLVKKAVRESHLLHEWMKVQKAGQEEYETTKNCMIPLNVDVVEEEQTQSRENVIEDNILSRLSADVSPDVLELVKVAAIEVRSGTKHTSPNTTLETAFSRAYAAIPRDSHVCAEFSEADLLATLPKGHCVFSPMLLLPRAFQNTQLFSSFFSSLSGDPHASTAFFSHLASETRTTHIAINAPIPYHQSSGDPNILRSPTKLYPLHGSFGPALPPPCTYWPTESDFRDAFWASTVQNDIAQMWAPRYTMFSSGNVTEKARVLRLPSVHEAVKEGNQSGQGCAAVDLFVGIGYFAFSYVKAGVDLVLGWDLNPWSVEGLKKGAERNGWGVEIVQEGTETQGERATRLVVFVESNRSASKRVAKMRTRIPPVRHVNCGMLPSAEPAAWKTAVRVLDPLVGGWLHLHETVREDAVQQRSEEIVEALKGYTAELKKERASAASLDTKSRNETHNSMALEHIERVKSVGPRMLHIVLDVWIPPPST